MDMYEIESAAPHLGQLPRYFYRVQRPDSYTTRRPDGTFESSKHHAMSYKYWLNYNGLLAHLLMHYATPFISVWDNLGKLFCCLPPEALSGIWLTEMCICSRRDI
jgi:hypothetical protein